jgi:hypothetical protein
LLSPFAEDLKTFETQYSSSILLRSRTGRELADKNSSSVFRLIPESPIGAPLLSGEMQRPAQLASLVAHLFISWICLLLTENLSVLSRVHARKTLLTLLTIEKLEACREIT